MNSVDGVLALLAEKVHPIPPAATSLDQARGYTLADAIRMDQDSPPFDRSQLDGFAVLSVDTREGAELEVIGRVDAGGRLFPGVVQHGEAVAINTGGVMPAGADGILMVEHSQSVTRDGRQFVKVLKKISPAYGIQKQGSDARSGDVVLDAGVRLGPAQLAVAATAGVWSPSVRMPRVGVLSTGDELIDGPNGQPGPGRIRNSNGPMLRALVAEAGGVPMDFGSCRDEADLIEGKLSKHIPQCDLLIVCGGMSMGTRDHVPALLKKLGVTIHVEKVRMKPGKPFVFGSVERDRRTRYIAGLPGNPVSSFVTFQRFVREAIGRMAGAASPGLRQVRARTVQDLEENGDREFFQPCSLRTDAGGMWQAEHLKWKGSADLFSLARAEGLIVRGINAPATGMGESVDVLVWP